MSTFEQMVGTLHKSVTDIVEAAPENRDELLATSFAEFEAAVQPELAKAVEEQAGDVLAKFAETNPALVEEPLFKGLGTVGRLANLLSSVARMAADIQNGTGYDNEGEAASDEVSSLLDHMVAVGELALRAAVNDHVEIADPDEDVDDSMSYVQVPNAEDPSEAAAMVVKCALPMDLAKYACDPASITMAVMELGSGLLLDIGVPQETLAKLFDVAGRDVLAKDASGAAPNPDPQADGQDADPNADQGADPNDIVAQLEIAGRIAAAQLMQIDHCMQLLSGGQDGAGSMDGADGSMGADDGTGADGTDPAAAGGQGADGSMTPDDGTSAGGADPAAAGGQGADTASQDPAPAVDDTTDPKKKPFGKSADGVPDPKVAALEKTISDMQQALAKVSTPDPEIAALRNQVAKLSLQPVAPKGNIRATGLSKAADQSGDTEEPMQKLADEYDACRTDEQRNVFMLKMAIKHPGLDLSALAKGR